MKTFSSLFFFVLLSLFSVSSLAAPHSSEWGRNHVAEDHTVQDTVNLYFFWSYNCPHCVAAHPFIKKLEREYPWLKVYSYEISKNSHNARLFKQMARSHGKETSFVPTFFVGDRMIVGYTSANVTGSEIRRAVIRSHHGRR
jgi:thiol-disulfide isomerase/thioredoxin